MRIFIAINFDEETKDRMMQVQERLSGYGKGSFTRRENLHLTLAFLGEVGADDIDAVKNCMDSVRMRRMKLEFSKIGCFRNDSELWWIGLKDDPVLSGIQRELIKNLREAGFRPDSKRFRPHITLARRMRAGRIESGDLLPEPFETEAGAMSLMLSERIDGRMVYTELYRR